MLHAAVGDTDHVVDAIVPSGSLALPPIAITAPSFPVYGPPVITTGTALVTLTDAPYSDCPASLSLTRPFTLRVPNVDVAHDRLVVEPKAPKPAPSPQSKAYCSPAATSADDGSAGPVSASVNGLPTCTLAGAVNVAVGARLSTC